MSYSDRNSNSGSIAAALGAAVAIDDIENVGNDTNSNNETTTVNKTENEVETKIEDSFNSKDIDVEKTETTTVGVDVDVAKTESKIEDSYNSKDVDVTVTKTESSVENETETKIEDSYNTKNETETKIEDSYNSKDIDVAVSKTETDIEDSYNTHNLDASIDVALTDAFKKIEDSYNSDDDWLELDNLDFDVMNVVGAGTLAGDGNDGMFNLSQVSEMMDKDVLIRPEVTNDAWFEQDAHAHGGEAYSAEHIGDRSSATTTADGAATLEAFTQNIVMGSNIQYNNIDLSVVGGDSTVNDSGDIG
jgi:hypothetical protein